MQQQEQQQARRIDLLSHYSLWENCRRDDSEIIGKKLHISPIHHDLEFYQKIRSGMPFFLGFLIDVLKNEYAGRKLNV